MNILILLTSIYLRGNYRGDICFGLLDTNSLWSSYTILYSPNQFMRVLAALHLCQHLLLLIFLILVPLVYSSMWLWFSFEFSWWEMMLRAFAYAYWPFVYFLSPSASQNWGSGGGNICLGREIKVWFGKADLSMIRPFFPVLNIYAFWCFKWIVMYKVVKRRT